MYWFPSIVLARHSKVIRLNMHRMRCNIHTHSLFHTFQFINCSIVYQCLSTEKDDNRFSIIHEVSRRNGFTNYFLNCIFNRPYSFFRVFVEDEKIQSQTRLSRIQCIKVNTRCIVKSVTVICRIKT